MIKTLLIAALASTAVPTPRPLTPAEIATEQATAALAIFSEANQICPRKTPKYIARLVVADILINSDMTWAQARAAAAEKLDKLHDHIMSSRGQDDFCARAAIAQEAITKAVLSEMGSTQ
jgi:hypothetical protein